MLPAESEHRRDRRQTCLEVALVLVVFFIQGASPVPDVNEPYYLGKAIHYWNPAWCAGDFFLQTADAHQVFYFAFGWLSLWLPPLALAWVGRIVTWALLAWAWQWLSYAVVPRRWLAVLTAAVFVSALDECNMAGEWVVGGVEAKGFAFVLVFLALEALVRDRWNRAWRLLGAATAFHVLVGGWSLVAAGLAWLLLPRATPRPPLRSMLPAMLAAFVLALVGLAPALALNWGVDRATAARANEIYVYERLYHHLDPLQIPPLYVVRFALLCLVWGLLCRTVPASPAARRMRRFVAATLLLALCGAAIGLLADFDRVLGAELLRYYWFRLADVAVPLGAALEIAALIAAGLAGQRPLAWRWLAIATALATAHLVPLAAQRPFPESPRAVRLHYETWRDLCDWIAQSDQVAPQARFLTPRQSQTFKWYAGRAEVVNWKEIPQDAAEIVAWWQRLREIYGAVDDDGRETWLDWPDEVPVERLLALSQKDGYDFQYVIASARSQLDWEVLYANQDYAVYRVPR